MIMSYLAKVEMSYCKFYNVLQKGGHYGEGGHYQNEQKGIKAVTYNPPGVKGEAKAG
jgi:hypothetical protein